MWGQENQRYHPQLHRKFDGKLDYMRWGGRWGVGVGGQGKKNSLLLMQGPQWTMSWVCSAIYSALAMKRHTDNTYAHTHTHKEFIQDIHLHVRQYGPPEHQQPRCCSQQKLECKGVENVSTKTARPRRGCLGSLQACLPNDGIMY